jgi:hypothetical protein
MAEPRPANSQNITMPETELRKIIENFEATIVSIGSISDEGNRLDWNTSAELESRAEKD